MWSITFSKKHGVQLREGCNSILFERPSDSCSCNRRAPVAPPPLGPDHPVCRHCQKQNPNLSFCRRELFHISSVDVRERRALTGRDGKRHEVVEVGKGEASCADFQSYARPEEDRLAAQEPWQSQLHRLCSQRWQLVGAVFLFSAKRKMDCSWGTWDRCSSYLRQFY